MNVIERDAFTDSFAVADLGFADDTFDAVFSAYAFDVDVEMEFAHAGDDGFFGLGIEMDSECRVFSLEFVECFGKLGGLFLGGFDGEGNDWFGNKHRGLW